MGWEEHFACGEVPEGGEKLRRVRWFSSPSGSLNAFLDSRGGNYLPALFITSWLRA